jgi:ribosomal protein S4
MSRKILILVLISLFLASATVFPQKTKLTYTMKTIGQHEDEVLGVFVNEDNTKVATCSLDETIKIWSLPDGKLLHTLTGHLGQVNNISFSGNDMWLASGSSDGTVRIWDVETGKQLRILKGHTDQVIGVYFSQDDSATFVASTSFDKTVKLWDIRLGTEIKTLRGHTLPTNNVAYSYDGTAIASCSDDKTIKIWSTDLTTREPLMTLIGHNAPVLSVIYSFDSKILASCDQSGEIIIWSMPSGKMMRKIKAHNELIQDISFAEDNKTLVSASLDKFVKLWDVTTGENLMILLELRLDNVIFRLGLGRTRSEARQIVDHKHVLVNGKCINIPSYVVKAGDVIEIKEKFKSAQRYKDVLEVTAGRLVPAWLEVNHETLTGTVKEIPSRDQIDVPVNEMLIVELYSK